MAGFATGYFGLECFLWFWLCMGVLGVGWVPAYSVYSGYVRVDAPVMGWDVCGCRLSR